jgi:hypothetical protein
MSTRKRRISEKNAAEQEQDDLRVALTGVLSSRKRQRCSGRLQSEGVRKVQPVRPFTKERTQYDLRKTWGQPLGAYYAISPWGPINRYLKLVRGGLSNRTGTEGLCSQMGAER